MPVSLSEFGITEEEHLEMAKRITKNDTVKVPGFVLLDLNLVLNIFNKIK